MAFYLKGFYDEIDGRAGGNASASSLNRAFILIVVGISVVFIAFGCSLYSYNFVELSSLFYVFISIFGSMGLFGIF
jgi:hypothetical protein